MKLAASVLTVIALCAFGLPAAAQTIEPLPCPNCVTAAAAQQSVLQSQIGQQQLSQNIAQTLSAQQQSLQLQQSLAQLRLQAQLDQNATTMQTILLQDQMALLQLQLIRLRAHAHSGKAEPKHNP